MVSLPWTLHITHFLLKVPLREFSNFCTVQPLEYLHLFGSQNSPKPVSPTFSISESTYVVFESALMLTCQLCRSSSVNVKKGITGSFLRITQFCAQCKKTCCWDSQPFIGSIPAGNILTSAAILYSGALPAKVLRVFLVLKCVTITFKTFFRHQNEILQPAVHRTWEKHQSSLLQSITAS